MFLVDNFSGVFSSSSTLQDSQEKKEPDQENSTLIKIAACIPVLGLVICKTQSNSLEGKLKKLPLPQQLRPHPILGKIMDENATPEEKKAACQRAIQLKSIDRDYTKAALINNLLTITLTVCAVALNVIPFVFAGILVAGFSITSAVFVVVLYNDRSIERFKEYATTI